MVAAFQAVEARVAEAVGEAFKYCHHVVTWRKTHYQSCTVYTFRHRTTSDLIHTWQVLKFFHQRTWWLGLRQLLPQEILKTSGVATWVALLFRTKTPFRKWQSRIKAWILFLLNKTQLLYLTKNVWQQLLSLWGRKIWQTYLLVYPCQASLRVIMKMDQPTVGQVRSLLDPCLKTRHW